MTRYDVTGSEGDFQPGSEEGVLHNKLGLTRKQDIDDAEAELLQALYEQELSASIERLTFDDIKRWHRQWLGNLYEWAGSLRTVNLSKGDFHFAAAAQLPLLIGGFEQEYLGRFSDLPGMDDDRVVEFLAQSHVEFILIHPFPGRERPHVAVTAGCHGGKGGLSAPGLPAVGRQQGLLLQIDPGRCHGRLPAHGAPDQGCIGTAALKANSPVCRQLASVSRGKRRLPDDSRFSISFEDSPVSIALELATERRICSLLMVCFVVVRRRVIFALLRFPTIPEL